MKKGYIFIFAFLFASLASKAQPVLSSGAATDVVSQGFESQWQGLKSNGGNSGLFLGTNINLPTFYSSSTGSNLYVNGNNSISLVYNKTTDVLTSTINSTTVSFTNLSARMIGLSSICRLNYLQIAMGDGRDNNITLNNISIGGVSVGSATYTGGATKYYNISNVDFTSSFSFSATLVLGNSNYSNGAESFVNISVGEKAAYKTMTLTPACESSPAPVTLSGLIPNKAYTAKYTIGLGAAITSASFTSTASGQGTFYTRSIGVNDLAQVFKLQSLNTGCDWTVSSSLSGLGIISIKNYWVGGISADWANPLNWAGGIMPDATCSKVVIPDGTLFEPSLTGQAFQVSNLEIKSGVKVEIKNATLKISGNITNQGVLDISNGTLELNGTSAAQNIAGSVFKNKTIKNLVNSNKYGINIAATTGDTLKIGGAISFGNVNNSTINTGDNVTLLSAATGTAVMSDMTNDGINYGNGITGKVVVERFVSNAAKWRFVSINSNTTQTFKQAWQEGAAAANGNPTPGYGMIIGDNKSASYLANGFDAYTPGGPTVKTYDAATNNWVGISNTNQLINTTGGYMAYIRSNRSGALSSTILRTSGPLKTGTQAKINIAANTFVAVGNPFAAPVNVNKINATGLQQVYYVWDPKLGGNYGLGAYQSLIKVGANYVIFPGGGSYGPQMTATNMIESGQAFFVKGGSTGGSLQFEERSKGAGTNLVFRGDTENSPMFRASLLVPMTDTALMLDATMVNFDTDFSNSIDDDDVLKIGNNNENVCIVSNNSYLMAERRTLATKTDTLKLFISGVRVQNYQWQFNLDHFDGSGHIFTLVDRYTNQKVVLDPTQTTTYQFSIVNIPASYATDRFYVTEETVAVLPVSITTVAATRIAANTVAVNWTVAGELNMDHYEAEASTNGVDFSSFANAQPQQANTGVASYSSMHLQATPGTNYYRIKAISIGGRVQYSSIVKVAQVNSAAAAVVSVYPNPVADKNMQVNFSGKAGAYELKLVGITGSQVFSKTVTVTDNNSSFSLPLGAGVAAGRYSLVVTGKDGSSTVQSLVVL